MNAFQSWSKGRLIAVDHGSRLVKLLLVENQGDRLKVLGYKTADLQEEGLLANEEIQRFAYIVTHDLRAPLVNIMGYTSELEMSIAPIQALVSQLEEVLTLVRRPLRSRVTVVYLESLLDRLQRQADSGLAWYAWWLQQKYVPG